MSPRLTLSEVMTDVPNLRIALSTRSVTAHRREMLHMTFSLRFCTAAIYQ